MSGHRTTALVALAGSGSELRTMACSGGFRRCGYGAGRALHAELAANQKTGTSAAARQPEVAQWAKYSFTSSCSTSVCVAKVNDSPAPVNQYAQQTGAYTWNGSQWVRANDLEVRLPASRRARRTRPGTVDHGADARR